MSVESTLRAQARRLMQAGKLPNRLPDRIWGGPGVGAPCTVCDAPVKRDQTEVEVEWSEGASKSNHHLHVPCFGALELEIREREPTQRTLAASGQLESAPAGRIEAAMRRGYGRGMLYECLTTNRTVL